MPRAHRIHVRIIAMDLYNNINELVKSLVGKSAEIQVSDPWDFCTDIARTSITASIEQLSIQISGKCDNTSYTESLLLRIAKPFAYQNLKYEYIIASPRHTDKGLGDLMNHESVPFNYLRISSDQAVSENPFLSEKKWRGGPEAFIGALNL